MSPRSILITGANRGLGLEFVKQILRQENPPTHLFAACRDPVKAEALQKLSNGSPALRIIKLDIEDTDSFNKVKDDVATVLEGRGLNLLVNNAGCNPRCGLDDVSADAMMNAYKINVVGPVILTQAFLPLLRQASEESGIDGLSIDRAAIVNISSIMGSITENGRGGLYPYRPSKSAVNMVTKSMSVDLQKDSIMAVCIHPGWVQTDMGGPQAEVTPEQSISGMLQVLYELDSKSNGLFYDFKGKRLPY